MDIFELAKKSGDSELISYSYADGVLTVHMEIEELDQEYKISIPTDGVVCNQEKIAVCYISLVELEKVLKTDSSGVFIPDPTFGKMMAEIRQGLGLAYGKKVSKHKYAFILKGYSNLLACIIDDLDEVKVQPIE